MNFLNYIKGLYKRQEKESDVRNDLEEVKNHINNENGEQ